MSEAMVITRVPLPFTTSVSAGASTMLRERGNVIVLTTLLWPDEIRAPEFPFLDEDVSVQMRELRSAVSDVERLSGDFEPTRYTDGYRDALRALVAARAAAGAVVRPTAAEQDTVTTELVATLRESADNATTGRAVDKANAAVRKAAAAKAAATRAANRAKAREKAGNGAKG